jgi:hypothetical protein
LNLNLNELLSKEQPKESVVTRFIKLFKSHGVHQNQIPDFFRHGLSIADFGSEELILKKLNSDLLEATSSLFNVRLPWLLCADNQVYSTENFYKHPGAYRDWISELRQSKHTDQMIAHLYLSTPRAWESDSVLVVQEPIGNLDDQVIYRHHFCSGWINKYWKARADIAACIAITLNANVYLKSSWVRGSLESIAKGECLPHELSELKLDKRKRGSKKKIEWQPEAWVFDPEDFVLGLAENSFGKRNGLARWLEHSNLGLMETGYSRESSAPLFAKHLKSLE